MRIVGTEARLKGLAAPSNLCMNQSLEAHEGVQHPLHHQLTTVHLFMHSSMIYVFATAL